jgi:hypothetical protein
MNGFLRAVWILGWVCLGAFIWAAINQDFVGCFFLAISCLINFWIYHLVASYYKFRESNDPR